MSDEFETFLNACKQSGQLFEDPNFKPVPASLFRAGSYKDEVAQWLRPSKFCPDPEGYDLIVDGVEAGDVKQGKLGDCWFLGGLCVVATRQDLFQKLFGRHDKQYGIYEFQFFKSGTWHKVVVDDRVPCDYNGDVVYAKCVDANETWVPLLEKAYAKLHNNYDVLNDGSVVHSLVDLTGGVPETVEFDAADTAKEIADDVFWKRLLKYQRESFLMSCAISNDLAVEKDNGQGILLNHAYGILRCVEVQGHRLLHMRNPWGEKEWTGAWSDGAPEWTDELLKELDHSFADDGTFYMAFEDFVKVFNKMYVCRLYEDDVGEQWEKLYCTGEWIGNNAGGCMNTPAWTNNRQFSITVNEPDTEVFITIQQPDIRMDGLHHTYEVNIGFYVIAVDDNTRKCISATAEDVVGKSIFTNNREASKEVVLEPDRKYILVPCTFYPHEHVKWELTMFSEHPIEVHELFDLRISSVKGVWSTENPMTAGGCMDNQTWVYNTQYLMYPRADEMVTIELIQLPPNQSPFHHIAFYVVRVGAGRGKRTRFTGPGDFISTDHIFVNSPTFAKDFMVEEVPYGEVYVETAEPYVIIPTTRQPNLVREFVLRVHSANGVYLEETDTPFGDVNTTPLVNNTQGTKLVPVNAEKTKRANTKELSISSASSTSMSSSSSSSRNFSSTTSPQSAGKERWTIDSELDSLVGTLEGSTSSKAQNAADRSSKDHGKSKQNDLENLLSSLTLGKSSDKEPEKPESTTTTANTTVNKVESPKVGSKKNDLEDLLSQLSSPKPASKKDDLEDLLNSFK
eukprot:TRINITY_DN3179_c0_g1_i2.p1 TRINITY_DN3179_c0_g1~~TRINITY_DN3179_c0_g1_i2.p1  ORF type:complete len:793 (-),score=249.36 TRINITY_DN3179_c0_g1_i2:962-3340(-)